MRGQLPKEKLQEIHDLLPKIKKGAHIVTLPGMSVDMHDLVNNTKIGIALVCLEDTLHRLEQVNNALHEAIACKVWYTEFTDQEHHDIVAIVTAKFYIDYATLLLYATAEDVSFFLVHFLDIEDTLKQYIQDPSNAKKLEKKNISSNAAKVGVFLGEKMQDHPLTKAVLQFPANREWQETMRYRNTWVHDKPPIIEGLGLQYNRKSRIVKFEDSTERMYFGGGSSSDYTIDKLLAIVIEATNLMTNVVNGILEHVREYRESRGEVFNSDNEGISFSLPVIKGVK